MKKTVFVLLFLLPILVSAQQIFQYGDDSGRIARVSFSGANLFVEQGGVVKAFSSTNNYTVWFSQDNCGVVFSADMLSLTLIVGQDKFIFKMILNGTINNPIQHNQSSGYQSGSYNTAPQKTKCGYCNGTGRIAGTVATYGHGGTKWCDFCKRDVPTSHCCQCKICPSCNGKGVR